MRKTKLPKPPKFIWADFDPEAAKAVRWVFYTTRADQRSNRPDLEPIKVRIHLATVAKS